MNQDSVNRLFQMQDLYPLLEERRELLGKLLEEAENKMNYLPEGSLHVVTGNHKKAQYYHRISPSDKSGKYIKKSDRQLAEQLAEKDYIKKLVGQIQEEIRGLDRFLKNLSLNSIFNYYDTLTSERKELFVPFIDNEEQFTKHWLDEKYDKIYLEDNKIYIAKDNEAVRSKSELIIADLLNDYGIPYRYEYPLMENGTIWARPDFTVLNVKKRKEFYWEHFGMMDDEKYLNEVFNKIYRYGRRGIYPGKNMIMTFESSKNPINTKYIEDIIKEFLL